MKKYKTWEAIKIISENKEKRFRNRNGDEMKYDTMCIRFFENDENVSWYGIDDTEWTLVQKPVDFMTAVKSGKRIKVEHDFLKDYEVSMHYHRIDVFLELIMCILAEKEIREVLLEGKFYIEDSKEKENE